MTNAFDRAPPSTLAAQIVRNIETAGQHQKSSSARAHVQELLRLILDDVEQSNRAPRKTAEAFEEDRRLITVIVKISLGHISNDDPFQEQAALQAEAKQCLSVVDLTVRRHAEVILLSPRASVDRSGESAPLMVWLLPCLIQVYGRSRWPDVQDAALKAIQACIDVQFKPVSTSLWLRPVTKFLQACANGKVLRQS